MSYEPANFEDVSAVLDSALGYTWSSHEGLSRWADYLQEERDRVLRRMAWIEFEEFMND